MTILIKIGTATLSIIYAIFKLSSQKKRILILSRQSDSPSLDIIMLKDKINKLHPDYEVVILCKSLGKTMPQKLSYLFHILKQLKYLATSKVLILDSYCIAACLLKHKKNFLIIQMWHSVGTMKKFGYSILDKPEGSSSKIANLMKMHKNYDYILAAGEGYREHLSQGFNYPLEKIVTLPLPRVERLKDRDYANEIRKEIFNTYPSLKDKKNIIYVPTFRKKDDDNFNEAVNKLASAIDYNKYNLIIKVHPLSNITTLENKNAIIDTKFSSFDMLFASDIAISDYSCIIYEAAVLKIPLYFYTYDFDDYMSKRDIYISYKTEVPGTVCNTTDELTNSLEANYDYVKLDYFLNKYVYTKSKHETQDIVEFIFAHLK